MISDSSSYWSVVSVSGARKWAKMSFCELSRPPYTLNKALSSPFVACWRSQGLIVAPWGHWGGKNTHYNCCSYKVQMGVFCSPASGGSNEQRCHTRKLLGRTAQRWDLCFMQYVSIHHVSVLHERKLHGWGLGGWFLQTPIRLTFQLR